MSVTAPEPPDAGVDVRAFVATVDADVRATVEHHAPCVPECPVCHPKGEG